MAGDFVIDTQRPHLGGNIRGGDKNTYCPAVWDFLIEEFRPRSIFDVGCGEGHLMNYFYDKGVAAIGSEGLVENINNARLKASIIEHDYTKGVLLPIPMDITISCEFVEHVEEKYIPNYLPQFCASDVLVFTHAKPGQDGYHHVNCQPMKYWVNLMIYFGFNWNAKAGFEARRLATESGAYLWETTLIFNKK